MDSNILVDTKMEPSRLQFIMTRSWANNPPEITKLFPPSTVENRDALLALRGGEACHDVIQHQPNDPGPQGRNQSPFEIVDGSR